MAGYIFIHNYAYLWYSQEKFMEYRRHLSTFPILFCSAFYLVYFIACKLGSMVKYENPMKNWLIIQLTKFSSIRASVYPTVRQSAVHLCDRLSFSPSARPSVCPSARPSVCPSVHLPVRLPVHLSICPSVTHSNSLKVTTSFESPWRPYG